MIHAFEVTNFLGTREREIGVNYTDTPSDTDEFGNDMRNGSFTLDQVFFEGVEITSKLSSEFTEYLKELLIEEINFQWK
tara:strand:+ start:138 stop:374 length:237 start_codon:yes stop_codon:yes gene_type:complete